MFEKKARYTMYDIIVFTQSSHVPMKVLIDNEHPKQRSRKRIEEQLDSGKASFISFYEATGAEGRIHPNSIAFLGFADVPDEVAEGVLSSEVKKESKE